MTLHFAARRRASAPRPGDLATAMMIAALIIFFLALVMAAATVEAAPRPFTFLSEPHSPAPLLVRRSDEGTIVWSTADMTRIRVSADPLRARIRVMQRFHGPFRGAGDCLYILPLPGQAELQSLRLTVGSRQLEAGLRRMPSEGDPDLLALPIGAVGPGEEVTIDISYTRPVAISGDRVVLSVPSLGAENGLSLVDAPTPVRVGSEMAEPPLAVEIDPGLPIAELRSPSHGIDISRGPGERRRVVLSGDDRPDWRELVLVWSPALPSASLAAMRRHLLNPASAADRQHGVLSLRPRRVGAHLALVPMPTAESPPLLGADALLTAIAAEANGAVRPVSAATAPLPLVAALLAVWLIGALHLSTRNRSFVRLPHPNPWIWSHDRLLAGLRPHDESRRFDDVARSHHLRRHQL